MTKPKMIIVIFAIPKVLDPRQLYYLNATIMFIINVRKNALRKNGLAQKLLLITVTVLAVRILWTVQIQIHYN